MQTMEFFERFTGGPTIRADKRICVTINSKGQIYLNKGAYRLIGEPDSVVLYYNKPNGIIGMAPGHPMHEDAFPIKPTGGGYFIYAAPFCRHFGIQVHQNHRFQAVEVDMQGIMRLDLKTTITTGWGVRKGKIK